MATHIQIKCTDDAITKGLRFAATACGMSLRQYTLYAAAKHTARLFADEPWGFDDQAVERALGNGRGAEQPAACAGGGVPAPPQNIDDELQRMKDHFRALIYKHEERIKALEAAMHNQQKRSGTAGA